MRFSLPDSVGSGDPPKDNERQGACDTPGTGRNFNERLLGDLVQAQRCSLHENGYMTVTALRGVSFEC